MTSDELIAEGRRLQRSCVFLRPDGAGPVAARWYERDDDEFASTGNRCWLTIDARHIPGLPASVSGYVTLHTTLEDGEQGWVEVTSDWPNHHGRELFAHPASVLPPIEAVFAKGSAAVGEWLRELGWDRRERYNDNFQDAAIVEPYERLWVQEFPIFGKSDAYAVLGGWHWPCADHDWYDLMDEQLAIFTIRDAEPWVEAWYTRSGAFRVIQRIT